MSLVIVPIVFLLAVILIKQLPLIGGKIDLALILTGFLTLFLAGIFNPGDWAAAWIDGLDRLAWVIFLSITGSIFAEISIHLGTVDTIIGALTAKFGKHPRILVICILGVLMIAGSLLGDAIAASTVVGILTIGILASMNLKSEKISAIIVMGASIGSIMPPITQSIALSSTLVGTDPDPVVRLGYLTSGLIFVIIAIYASCILVKKDNVPGANPDIEIKFRDETAGEILKENWKSLIPLFFLILVIFLRTVNIPVVSVDLGPAILKSISFTPSGAEEPIGTLYDALSGTTILKGMTNGIVLSITLAIAFAFLFFKKVRSNTKEIMSESWKKVEKTVLIQVCCAFMLGSFYQAGSIDAVQVFAQSMNGNVLKIGGAIALVLIGMLTGSQSTAQNVIFSFLGPALVTIGVSPTIAALAGANLAAAGQGMPPADLTTFVVVGIVAAQYGNGEECDPLKSMFYSLPMCLCMFAVGIICLFV